MKGNRTKYLKPTYEGLKHGRVRPCILRVMDLKPTYEGLKPVNAPEAPVIASDLKPTYEGLKPRVDIELVLQLLI